MPSAIHHPPTEQSTDVGSIKKEKKKRKRKRKHSEPPASEALDSRPREEPEKRKKRKKERDSEKKKKNTSKVALAGDDDDEVVKEGSEKKPKKTAERDKEERATEGDDGAAEEKEKGKKEKKKKRMKCDKVRRDTPLEGTEKIVSLPTAEEQVEPEQPTDLAELQSSPDSPDAQSGDRETQPQDTEGADDKLLDDERLPWTLFVGNVSKTATRKQIQKLFSSFAAVESVRIRNVIAANPKIPKKVALLANRLAVFSDSISAYVVFKPAPGIEEMMKAAVDATNMTMFEGKHLRVTPALQTKGRRRQSVFVGNLPFDVSDEELIMAFLPVAKDAGVKLMNVRVNRDKDTGVGRGVGFATFDDVLGIQACLNKSGEIFVRGREVRIERAFKTKNMKSKSFKKRRNAFRPSHKK